MHQHQHVSKCIQVNSTTMIMHSFILPLKKIIQMTVFNNIQIKEYVWSLLLQGNVLEVNIIIILQRGSFSLLRAQ